MLRRSGVGFNHFQVRDPGLGFCMIKTTHPPRLGVSLAGPGPARLASSRRGRSFLAGAGPAQPPSGRLGPSQKNCLHFSICACHPCAGAMRVFSVSFEFKRMILEGNPAAHNQEVVGGACPTPGGARSLLCHHYRSSLFYFILPDSIWQSNLIQINLI